MWSDIKSPSGAGFSKTPRILCLPVSCSKTSICKDHNVTYTLISFIYSKIYLSFHILHTEQSWGLCSVYYIVCVCASNIPLLYYTSNLTQLCDTGGYTFKWHICYQTLCMFRVTDIFVKPRQYSYFVAEANSSLWNVQVGQVILEATFCLITSSHISKFSA